jgi:hypothetical protein
MARLSSVLLASLAFAALCSGCYHGAIYSSYQEGGLGIRTTAESDAPIKVHFGYDRSVVAFVPRRGDDAKSEEATALISRDDVSTNLNPMNTGTTNLIAVNSAFITGTAAIVASAPDHAVVNVHDPNSPATVKQTYAPSGDAAVRVAAAVAGQDIEYSHLDRAKRDQIVHWLAQDPATRVPAMQAWLGPEALSPGIWVEQATPDQLDMAIQHFIPPASAGSAAAPAPH